MSVYQEAYHLPEFTYDKYEKLTIEQRGPVYICSFNDPGNLNAMSYEQMAEFNDFLNLVRYDKDCRVIVLTGEGKSFCAGFNLNDLFLDPPEDMGRIQRDFYVMQRMCSDQVLNMAKCEQPIIGALKGFAVGGGLSIATACDMRILGESFKMNAGYLSIGYTGTDMSGSFYLPKIVGYARACEILMNPRRFKAETLAEWGYAVKVVPDEEVVEEAVKLAEEICRETSYQGSTPELARRSLTCRPGQDGEPQPGSRCKHPGRLLGHAEDEPEEPRRGQGSSREVCHHEQPLSHFFLRFCRARLHDAFAAVNNIKCKRPGLCVGSFVSLGL